MNLIFESVYSHCSDSIISNYRPSELEFPRAARLKAAWFIALHRL